MNRLINDKRIAIALLIVIGAVAVKCKPSRQVPSNVKAGQNNAALVEQPKIPVTTTETADGKLTHTLTFKDEKGVVKEIDVSERQKSLIIMVNAFAIFTSPGKSVMDFTNYLKGFGLSPLVAKDYNEGMDDLAVIRTRNSLPGLRYIHAQFDNMDGKMELQHLSFELAKAPDAQKQALELMRKIIPLGTQVLDTAPGFIKFKNNGYVIWLNELTVEDMIGDRHNAYDQSDVGRVRIAIERDPHEHEH